MFLAFTQNSHCKKTVKEYFPATRKRKMRPSWLVRMVQSERMAIFYRAVRNLVDFSLVTKLTKHVPRVRETVRKCEKKHVKMTAKRFSWRQTRKNDITIFGFLFLYKIPDFTIRLVPWSGDKNSPMAGNIPWLTLRNRARCTLTSLFLSARQGVYSSHWLYHS